MSSKITEVYVFVFYDRNHEIVANVPIGNHRVDAVCYSRKCASDMAPLVQALTNENGHPWKLLRFTQVEDVTELMQGRDAAEPFEPGPFYPGRPGA